MKKILINDILLDKLKSILVKYKNYRSFSSSKDDCYKYTSLLGVDICPYCNINYTYTIINTIRAELDHFVPQSSPSGKALTMDPYNLVPSCHICNAILKRNRPFSEYTHIHPLKDDFDSIVEFSIDLIGSNPFDPDNIKIVFSRRTNNLFDLDRAIANIEVFKLKERYSCHRDIVIQHFHLMYSYNRRKIREIGEILNFTKKDYYIERLIYNYGNLKINSVSLGKLIKDIYRKYMDFIL